MRHAQLPLNATTIVEAAYWPDAIRPLGFYVFAPWHYIDIPLVRDEDGANITPPPVPTTNNVVWAIEQGVRVLRTVDASAAEKSAALRFVLHFVGDVHQPLHAASLYSAMFPNGDYGGNSFHLTGSSHWSNLHSECPVCGVVWLCDCVAVWLCGCARVRRRGFDVHCRVLMW